MARSRVRVALRKTNSHDRLYFCAPHSLASVPVTASSPALMMEDPVLHYYSVEVLEALEAAAGDADPHSFLI